MFDFLDGDRKSLHFTSGGFEHGVSQGYTELRKNS